VHFAALANLLRAFDDHLIAHSKARHDLYSAGLPTADAHLAPRGTTVFDDEEELTALLGHQRGLRHHQRIMLVAQRIGRRMRIVFSPQRVGMVVHGYGVPHAHLILVPQHGPYDITSARYGEIENGRIVFSMKNIPFASRNTLDEHARLLASAFSPNT